MKALLLALLISTPAHAADPDPWEDFVGQVNLHKVAGNDTTIALKIRMNQQWCPFVKNISTRNGITYVYCDDGQWGAWYKVTIFEPLTVIEGEPPK